MSQVLPTNGRITQTFSTPVNYIAGRNKHEAVDIVTKGEIDYCALGNCKVYRVIDKYNEGSTTGYGNEVYLDYGNDLLVRSCHHNKIYVKEGDELTGGDRVASIGRTGYRSPVSIYHTHIEVLKGAVRIDPLPIFNQLNEQFMSDLKVLRNDHEAFVKSTWKRLDALELNVSTILRDVQDIKNNKWGKKRIARFLEKMNIK
jgi:murein DD-endopeptidase MepM/ murein hydrolase activator NlpD